MNKNEAGHGNVPTIDSLLPPAVAEKAENLGVSKGNLDALSMFMLAILAGAFIAIGAIFYTVVVTGTAAHVGFGLTKLIGGLAFCLGLILVVVGGAELFTGNNLIVMAAASGKLPFHRVIRNWVIVFLGNFVGAVLTALVMVFTDQFTMGGGAVGATALSIANAKCSITVVQAVTRGIYCNALVCLAIWLTFSCRTTGDKIIAIVFPITAFVAAGFEHCVANMYFIAIGLFIKAWATDAYWMSSGVARDSVSAITVPNFLVGNLLPVTIGNVIGGVFFVGLIYWLIYLRKR